MEMGPRLGYKTVGRGCEPARKGRGGTVHNTRHTRGSHTQASIIIGGNSHASVKRGALEFLKRVNELGLTLNDDQNDVSRIDQDIVYDRPYTFLGEEYLPDGTVRNTEKNVSKAREAWALLLEAAAGRSERTRRNLCSLISLLVWLAATIQIPLCEHFAVLRLYSAVAAREGKWGAATPVTAHTLAAIRPLVDAVLANAAVKPSRQAAPAREDAYDVIAFVDAAKGGFGVIARTRDGRTLEYSCGWTASVKFSAWAEPFAAAEAIRLIRTGVCRSDPNAGLSPLAPTGRIAIVTDHEAVSNGAQRWWSGCGGVSLAHPLNELFREMYGASGVNAGRGQIDVFFVPGARNPADAPSRRAFPGSPMQQRAFDPDLTLPGLGTCVHHHPTPPARPWWCV